MSWNYLRPKWQNLFSRLSLPDVEKNIKMTCVKNDNAKYRTYRAEGKSRTQRVKKKKKHTWYK